MACLLSHCLAITMVERNICVALELMAGQVVLTACGLIAVPAVYAGEGIHTAMMGGRAAAETLLDMRATGDFSKASTAQYTRRWMKAFGHDFPMSTKFAELIYR